MKERPDGSVNFRKLAREMALSVMTIYRVVNGKPNVSPRTRMRVIEELNRRGCFVHSPQRQIKVLFDFTAHRYLAYYGNQLMERLSRLGYSCLASDHRKDREMFLNLASECDTVVFASIPDDEVIAETRRVNPDAYTITLSTSSSADVTISPDNIMGAELAAGHLHEHGHRHIAIHCSDRHPTRMERLKAFCAEMRLLSPGCRLDIIREKAEENTADVLLGYFRKVRPMPTALFFLAGEFAMRYCRDFVPVMPEKCRRLSLITFDRPEDWEFDVLEYDFDRIEFFSSDLLDWAEYYITNRPMMKIRKPIHTSIGVQLVIRGSVVDRPDQPPASGAETDKTRSSMTQHHQP